MTTKRGRKSASELAIAPPAAIETVQRPDAPYDLTDEQSAEWWAVVNTMPADWFPRETQPLLAQYCRHIVTARRIAQLMAEAEKAEEFDLREYGRLAKLASQESRAIAMLATKLRLSQQSIYDQSKKKPKRTSTPWGG